MTTNPTKKTAGATNSNGPHTDTNSANFPTEDTPSKAIALPPVPTSNEAAILNALKVLCDPADVVELRALTSKGRKRTDSGYFDADHWDDLAEYAKCLSESGAAVYFTLNPVIPQLLSRYSNRIEPNATSTTTDKDVTKRRWLMIDLDPVRPSGTSATATQLEAAANKAREIHSYLVDIGWPKPVAAMSGNGYHMLYAIDLPNDAASTALVKGVLLALADRFDDGQTKAHSARFCSEFWFKYSSRIVFRYSFSIIFYRNFYLMIFSINSNKYLLVFLFFRYRLNGVFDQICNNSYQLGSV